MLSTSERSSLLSAAMLARARGGAKPAEEETAGAC
jgi:hypothetical protein